MIIISTVLGSKSLSHIGVRGVITVLQTKLDDTDNSNTVNVECKLGDLVRGGFEGG
jgi:hypothetical protein